MIDIIIVNYNSTDHLIGCLKSVETALDGKQANIFIQDNFSTDGAERIQTEFPHISLTMNPKNLGFAKAVNNALRQGSGRYAMLLNPDTRVERGFFHTVLEYMENNPAVGIMGPGILNRDGTLQNSARAFPTLMTAFFGRTSFLSRKFPNNPFTRKNLLSLNSDGKTPMTADWISGACMVVRRCAIETTGLLDERFFMYWEDADWCRRMWESRWKVVYFPQASVCHYGSVSSKKRYCRSAIDFHKSVYRLFAKYAGLPLSLLKPVVFSGLFLRLSLILCSHMFQQFIDVLNHYIRLERGKAAPLLQIPVHVSARGVTGRHK